MVSKNQIIDMRFDIERKGYSREQVDRFLDEIALDIDSISEKARKFDEMQSSIMACMMQTQKNSEELMRKAEQDAKAIIENANAEADRILASAQDEVAKALYEKQNQIANIDGDIEKLESVSARYKEKLLAEIDELRALVSGSFERADKPELSNDAKLEYIDLESLYKDAPETEEQLKQAISEMI